MRSLTRLDTGWTFHTAFSPELITAITPGTAVLMVACFC